MGSRCTQELPSSRRGGGGAGDVSENCWVQNLGPSLCQMWWWWCWGCKWERWGSTSRTYVRKGGGAGMWVKTVEFNTIKAKSQQPQTWDLSTRERRRLGCVGRLSGLRLEKLDQWGGEVLIIRVTPYQSSVALSQFPSLLIYRFFSKKKKEIRKMSSFRS